MLVSHQSCPLQCAPAPAPAWESETLRSRDPTWVPMFPAFQQRHRVAKTIKKNTPFPPPPAVTKQVFRFSFRMGKVSQGILELSQEGRSQGEKSKNDCNPNEPCHYLKVKLVFPPLQNGDNEVHYLLSFFRNYPVTQQGK